VKRKPIEFGAHVRVLADDDPNQQLDPEERFDRGVVGQIRFLITVDARDVPRPYCVARTILGGPTTMWVHDIEEVTDVEREKSLDWTEFNELLARYRKMSSRSYHGSLWEQEGASKILGRLVDARDALIWRGYVPMSLPESSDPEKWERFYLATTPSELALYWRGGFRP